MSISEKVQTTNNNIEQDKGQYNLDKETAKVSALSSRNVCKYEFLTGKDVLPEQNMLEKAATTQRFVYSPLGNELKAQMRIGKKTVPKVRRYLWVWSVWDAYEFCELL